MSDMKVQGEFVMDTTQGDEAFARVESGARKMADVLEKSGRQGADALSGIGESADRSAKTTERATSSILSQIKRSMSETQRAVVEMQGYSAKSADGLEELARRRGADVTAIQGQIQALRQLQSEHDALAAAQRNAAANSLFEQQHAAAQKLVRDAEYVRVWTSALEVMEAKQRELAALPAFERERDAAEQARRRADATHALTRALDIQEAREREIAALPAFEREKTAADQARRRADATAALTQVLEQQEAAERRLASQNSFLASLESQANSIGKTRSELLALQAAQLGVTDKAAPFIAQLREQERGMGGVGVSAGQTAAALRQLPMQFSDIVVSLQAGQAPLTVFLQQGAQIKDSFGGSGAAVKAMGGYVLGLINPLTMAAAGVATLGYAYAQGSKEADAYRMAMVSTGNAAGTTSGQLKSYAQEVAATIGTQGKAAESLAQLASSGKVANEVLREAAQASIAYERATGQAMGKTAESFAALGGEPLKAVLKLNDSMNFLTESTYRQIKSLEEQGRTADAAAVAQRSYADALTSRAGEIERNLGSIERGWLNVKNMAKSAWDAMLNVGRADTNEDKLSAINRQIAELEKRRAGGFGETEGGAAIGRPSSAAQARVQAELAALGAQKAALEGVIYAERERGRQEAENAANRKLYFEWEQKGAEFQTKEQKRDAEILRARTEGQIQVNAGLRTQAEVEERIAQIRKKYEEKPSSGAAGTGQNEVAAIRAKIAETERYLTALQAQGAEAEKLTAGEKLVIKIQEELKTSISGVARAQKEKALAAAQTLAALDRQIVREQELVKANAKAEAEYRKGLAAMADKTDAIDKQARELEAANAVYGKSKIAIEEHIAAQDKERLLWLQNKGLTGEYTQELARQVEARQRLVAAMKESEFKAASAKYDEAIAAAQAQNDLVREEISLIGLTEVERKKIIAAREAEIELAKELREIDKLGLGDAQAEELRIKARAKARTKAETAQAKATLDEWQKASDDINRALTDSLFRAFESGKDFGETLRDSLKAMFNTLVLRPIISAVMQPVSMLINGAVQGGMSALMGGGSGGAMGLLNGASTLNTAYNLFNGGIASSLGAGVTQLGTMFGNQAAMQFGMGMQGMYLPPGVMGPGVYSSTGAMGAAAGTAVGIGAGVLGGVYGGRLVSGGFSMSGNSSGNSAVNTGTAIGAAVGSIIPVIGTALGALIGGLLGGAFNRAFGYKLKDTGLEATLGSNAEGGSESRQYQFYKGGWFKSDKTEYSQTDPNLEKFLDGAVMATRASLKSLAEAFDLPTVAIDTFGLTIKESFKGLDEEETNQKIAEIIERYATGVSEAFIGGFGEVPDWIDRIAKSDGAAADKLKAIAEMPNQLLQAFGTSRDALVQTFAQGLVSGDAMGAGQAVADQLVASIEATMLGSAAGRIFDIMNSGLITPILDAVMTGATVSEALSEASIQRTIAKAQEAAAAFAAVWNDPEFKSIMETIRTGFGSALGDAGAAMQYQPRYIKPAQDLAQAADAASKAAEDAKKKWEDIWRGLRDARFEADVALLRAMGQEEAALAKERARAIEGFDAEQTAYWDATQAILRHVDALQVLRELHDEQAQLQVALLRAQGDESGAALREFQSATEKMTDAQREAYRVQQQLNESLRAQIAWTQELPSVLDKFRTPEQRIAAQYDSIAGQLIGAGLGVDMGQGALAAALAGATKDEIFELASALFGMGEISEQTRLVLVRTAGALADLKDAERQRIAQQRQSLEGQLLGLLGDTAELRRRELAALEPANRALQERIWAMQDARQAVDGAYGALEREVAAQRRAVEQTRSLAGETVAGIKSVFGVLKDAVRSLYGDVDSTSRMLTQQGQDFIAQALDTARLTGYLPDADELREAIGAATDGLSRAVYASQFDADRERLILAGRLADLKDLSGEQLSEAERQAQAAEASLQHLDGILDNARLQIDALRGIDTSVLGVDARIAQLADAIRAETAARQSAFAVLGSHSGSSGSTAGGHTSRPAPSQDYLTGANGAGYSASTDVGYQAGTGLPWRGQDIRDAAAELVAAGNAKAVYDAVREQGFTLAQADAILQLPAGTAEDWARAMHLPIYHEGTPYVPRTGFALLEQGERVLSAADNRAYGRGASGFGASAGIGAILSELRALREQTARLEARLAAIEKTSADAAELLDQVSEGGNGLRTYDMYGVGP